MYYRVKTANPNASVIEAELIIRAGSVQEAVNMTDACALFDIVSVIDVTLDVENDNNKRIARAAGLLRDKLEDSRLHQSLSTIETAAYNSKR